MPETIIAEICPGRRVIGLVTLGAIGRICAARYDVAGIPIIAGVVVSVVVVIIIGVVGASIIGVVIATVAITQRAPGRYPGSKPASPAITVVSVVIAAISPLRKLSTAAPSEISTANEANS